MTPIETSASHEHHRDPDDGAVCHYHRRNRNGASGGMDTHQKWVIGVISAGIVTLLAFFAVENYRMVNSRIDDQKSALHKIVDELAQHQTAIVEMRTNQKTMMESQQRIEDKLDLIIRKAR